MDATDATAEQSTGLVLISTTVDFGAGEAAGTGMVIDSSGIVVTNHHVVEGATDIEVDDRLDRRHVRRGGAGHRRDGGRRRPAARRRSTGCRPFRTDRSGAGVRSAVTAVGDAGGDGGILTAASGTVTALHQSITVNDDNGGTSRLRNLIEVDADIIPGDSGGALLDADGDVIGMNVAASSGGANITGYVIPIRRVLRIADAVLVGRRGRQRRRRVRRLPRRAAQHHHLGGGPGRNRPRQPRQAAGLSAGDTITAVDGTAVTSAPSCGGSSPPTTRAETVPVTWTDSDGASHTVDVTLTQGPVA